MDEEHGRDNGPALELEVGEVTSGLLEAGLDAIDLLGLGGLPEGGEVNRGGGDWGSGLDGLKLLGSMVERRDM